MIDFVAVGAKITKYRKEKGLTQEQLADALFISRQLISKWEKGTGVPTIDSLLELCRFFDVSFEELLCLDNELAIDENDIFKGHDRLFIIKKIINGELEINVANTFYQFSPSERMVILKAIREGKVKVNIKELIVKLTDREKNYLAYGGGYLL